MSDIIFLQKRDRPIEIEPDWVHLGKNDDGFAINSYFIDHPEMILGRQTSESTQYGKQDFTVEPIKGLELADQLHDAVKYIRGTYTEAELPDLGDGEAIDTSIPADPNVKNYSYTVVDGDVYYRENSRMVKPELNATATERVKGMVELRDCVQKLIGQQMDGFVSDASIRETQRELNDLYDKFTAKHGLINSRGNALAFADDSSYYLLCSLEVLDEDNNLKRNHLTEQWASEFLRLYPSANILAATKKDFEPRNRKKFCGRIATGDYDAIIIGHSQFERIPVSQWCGMQTDRKASSTFKPNLPPVRGRAIAVGLRWRT